MSHCSVEIAHLLHMKGLTGVDVQYPTCRLDAKSSKSKAILFGLESAKLYRSMISVFLVSSLDRC